MTTSCKYCGALLPQSEDWSKPGRKNEYCNNAHRQAYYRYNKNGFQRQRISPQFHAITLRNFSSGNFGYVNAGLNRNDSAGANRNANGAFGPDETSAGYKQVSWC